MLSDALERKRAYTEECCIQRNELAATRRTLKQLADSIAASGNLRASMEIIARLHAIPLPRVTTSLKTLQSRTTEISDLCNQAEIRLLAMQGTLTGDGCQIDGHIEPESDLYRKPCGHREANEGYNNPKIAEPKSHDQAAQQSPFVSVNFVAHICDAGTWRRACPAVQHAGQPVETMAELVDAASFLTLEIGASRDALAEAHDRLGRCGSALLGLYVYQLMIDAAERLEPMANPGGLFRTLVRRAWAGLRPVDADIAMMAKARSDRRSRAPSLVSAPKTAQSTAGN